MLSSLLLAATEKPKVPHLLRTRWPGRAAPPPPGCPKALVRTIISLLMLNWKIRSTVRHNGRSKLLPQSGLGAQEGAEWQRAFCVDRGNAVMKITFQIESEFSGRLKPRPGTVAGRT